MLWEFKDDENVVRYCSDINSMHKVSRTSSAAVDCLVLAITHTDILTHRHTDTPTPRHPDTQTHLCFCAQAGASIRAHTLCINDVCTDIDTQAHRHTGSQTHRHTCAWIVCANEVCAWQVVLGVKDQKELLKFGTHSRKSVV